jgi:hypothetical protein
MEECRNARLSGQLYRQLAACCIADWESAERVYDSISAA